MVEDENNGNGMGRLIKISDSVALAEEMRNASMGAVVSVGDRRVLAEVVAIDRDTATLCFLEDARGLSLGDCVVPHGELFTAELGPGLLGNIFDAMGKRMPALNSKGIGAASRYTLDQNKLWHFEATLGFGDKIKGGDVYGTVKENGLITHRITVPQDISGSIVELRSGDHSVTDRIGKIKLSDGTIEDITLTSRRNAVERTGISKLRQGLSERLTTNIEAIDTHFPIFKGGSACIVEKNTGDLSPLLNRLAEKADADIVVYVSCSPRLKEIYKLFGKLSDLKDPQSGRPLAERTVMIVNRSDMTAAAREKAAYLGATVAEYYRDMGYSVLLLIDSFAELASAAREKAFDAGCEFYLYPTDIDAQLSGLLARVSGSVGTVEGHGSVTVIASVDAADESILRGLEKNVGALWVFDDVSDETAVLNKSLSYSEYKKLSRSRLNGF